MFPVRNLLVGSTVLLALIHRPATADVVDLCMKVVGDWNTMKSHIESLKDESGAIDQLKADVQSLTAEVNGLKSQFAQCDCAGGGQGAGTGTTTTPVVTAAATPAATAAATPAATPGATPVATHAATPAATLAATLKPGNEDLKEVLHKSMLFYEAQRSGKLPANNRISWRSDSALDDKGKNGEDLSGGWYDAGDFVKFGLPMASSVTLLAWGLIEYREAYRLAGELEYGLDCIKWPLDYFIKAHVADNKFYGQVGSGKTDHDYWGRPEDMDMARPAFLLDAAHGGSDVAGETAAAMAAASIVFRPTDPIYADTLLAHARKLYDFGYNYKQKYHLTILEAEEYYKSTSYNDELAWGALWLHKATKEADYLTKAEKFLDTNEPYAQDWDDKAVGAQLLYYIATKNAEYKAAVENYLTNWFPGGNIPHTPKGLAFRSKWGSLRYSANTAFVALVAADNGIKTDEGRQFAKTQIEYMMGSAGRSYIVGFGNKPPVRPHHAAASCPSPPATCDWPQFESSEPNPHILYGALVGGPNQNDDYVDRRDDYAANEVTTDYNAGFQSAVAGLLQLYVPA